VQAATYIRPLTGHGHKPRPVNPQQKSQPMSPRAGTRRDCRHTRVRHHHGTTSAYVADRCRCDECTGAYQQARRGRSRAIAHGRWQPYVDAQPVRDHITRLRTAGAGINQISQLAEVARSTLRRTIYGRPSHALPPPRRIRPDTAQRILAITLDQASATRVTVSSARTRRRVAVLIDAGWTHHTIAARLGRSTTSLRRAFARETITRQTAVAIQRVYRRRAR